jgi:pSer/pThr/pTyr-binding forkhead associated (FHA) protein
MNGVFVNNQSVLDAPLYTGDLVKIGCVKLLVEAGTPLTSATDKLRQIADALPES